jgi:hypothetical protein
MISLGTKTQSSTSHGISLCDFTPWCGHVQIPGIEMKSELQRYTRFQIPKLRIFLLVPDDDKGLTSLADSDLALI